MDFIFKKKEEKEKEKREAIKLSCSGTRFRRDAHRKSKRQTSKAPGNYDYCQA